MAEGRSISRTIWWKGKVDTFASDYKHVVIFARSPKSNKVIRVILDRHEMEKIWDIVNRSKKYDSMGE